MDASDALVICT